MVWLILMAVLLGNANTGKVFRSFTPEESAFSCVANAAPLVVTPGSSGQSTVTDSLFDTQTGATVDNNFQIVATDDSSLSDGAGFSFESLHPSIATVNSSGYVARVSSGTARILVKHVGRARKGLNCAVSRSTSSTTTWNSYVSGSLGKHLYDDIRSRISGKNYSTDRDLYSSANYFSGVYERNTNNWLSGVDLTCVAVRNTTYGTKGSPTAITPRHVVMANHYPVSVGATVSFVTSGNVTVNRTISSRQQVGSTDIMIGKLSSDLPGTITPAKLLPASWRSTYLPHLASQASGLASPAIVVPMVMANQFSQIVASELFWSGSFGLALADTAEGRTISSVFSNWWRAKQSGDSGIGNFLIVNGVMVLLSHSYGDSSGIDYSANLSAIDSVLSSLGGGYSLSTVTLSGFNSY